MTAEFGQPGGGLRLLADPTTHGGEKVQRIDTHVASVFLAGERALKIKRAVRFPFLDYSTLARRKQACEAELAVNTPYAPEIYRGVVAITREADGKLAIGGRGAPVEWAVEMRRFDEKRTLDHLTGEIDEALADALGRAVAEAHARAEPVEGAPWITAIGSYIGEHAEAFRKHPELFARAEIDTLERLSRAAYEHILPLLRDRGRRGLIRRIHGDLHLGNIVLIDGKPVLFDAIEFSEIIASGDVLYDLAFLLMDLLERGLPLPANVVLNRYLAQTHSAEDLDGLAALPFFLSLRAAIRAMVTAARMERAPAGERDGIANAARAYFAFAQRAIAPPAAKFVAVGGLSGTGKTRLARVLAPSHRADARRGHRALGCGAQGAVRRRRDRQAAGRGLRRRSDRARLRRPRRQGAPHPGRRAFGHRRCGVRASATNAPRCRRGEIAANLPLRGLFLTADLPTRLARVGGRRATLPMPTRRWREHRKAMTSARSIGRRLTHRERRRHLVAGPGGPRGSLIDGG